ncbi:MAG: helix-turn-helix domain-containing protein [Saprospiraceae bacterium]
MKTLGEILKNARTQKKMILRKVSAKVDIDQSLISKFEKNDRKPTKDQLLRLAKFYNLPEDKLLISWYAEKIAQDLRYTASTTEILKVAEQKIEYYKKQKDEK